MYVYLWEYRVRPEATAQFQEKYGAEGAWVALFRRATGYLRTELLTDLDDPYRYVTIDTWESQQAYDRFRQTFASEFAELDALCEGLTLEEVRLGHFSVD
jgi:quinol monooxygenase YgiN